MPAVEPHYAGSVLEMLRQRRWLGFTLFVAAMLALCVVLARWQWGRYQQRIAENELLDAALSAPAVPIGDLLDPAPATGSGSPLPRGAEWRMVTAVGTFDAEQQSAVRRRPLDGRNGFWIVTPLVTDEGTVLVNRGWVAATGDALARPTVPPPPAGEVSVAGRLRPAESTEQDSPAPPGQAWAADPQVLVTPASTARFDAYIELRDGGPAAEGLTQLSDPGHKGLNNLVYSVQWLVFAAVGAFGWWRLVRQESLRARGPRPEPAPAES